MAGSPGGEMIHHRPMGKTAARYSISTILVFGFGGLMALAVTTVLYLGIVAGGSNTRSLLTRVAEAEIDGIETTVSGLLDPIEIQSAWIAEQVANGKIDLGDRREIERLLSGALSALPRVTGMSLLTTDGRFNRYVRSLKWMIVSDWRTRADITAAMSQARSFKSAVCGDIVVGDLVAGAVGAAGRLNYTMHGDAVNLAARLESMNKEFGTRIMVSQGIVDGAPDTAFRRVADTPVRGREGTETVYMLDDG
jgi:hypothetical protein